MQSKTLFRLGIAVFAFAILAALLVSLQPLASSDAFQDSVMKAGTIRVLEGLPHQNYYHDIFEEERKTKPNLELGGFHFYEGTLELSPGDVKKVVEILHRTSTYEPYLGEKKCGGYHPDFAVSWTLDHVQYHALLCFGCGEVKLLGPSGERHYDLERDSARELENILRNYHKNAPESTLPSILRFNKQLEKRFRKERP